MANTKLTSEQKSYRKEWLKSLKDCGGEIATVGAFTVAKAPDFKGARMAEFSVSYCSPFEVKNRRKVGEYHALNRLVGFDAGNWVVLPNRMSANSLAYLLNDMDEDDSAYTPADGGNWGSDSSTMNKFFG